MAWLGPATVFPQAVGLGATWDEDLVRRVGEAVSWRCGPSTGTARRRPASGINSLQAWAPVVNLLRDPRWGRNEEGYSEDPLHTARARHGLLPGPAPATTRTYWRAAPVLKHWLAYNNEDDRCVTSSGSAPARAARVRPAPPSARPSPPARPPA